VHPFVILKGSPPGEAGCVVIGDDVVIKKGAYITSSLGKISIGSHCHIGHNVWLGGKGEISIGDNTMISINTVVVSSNHDYSQISLPYHKNREISKPITIGRDVWIGANCTILPGVRIGDGAVVGAGSLINSDVAENALVVGNPQRVVKIIRRDI